MLDVKTLLLLNEKIVLRSLGEKYWALDMSIGTQYRLNGVAYYLLGLFKQPLSIEEALEMMVMEYDVTRERLLTDCNAIWQFAISKGILKEVRKNEGVFDTRNY